MYLCAIETGSYSDYPRRYERTSDRCVCGKLHRTYAKAQGCMDTLRKRNDTAWLSAHVHTESGMRACDGGRI